MAIFQQGKSITVVRVIDQINKEGTTILIGASADLLHNPAVRRAYLGG